jgi:exonuclease VII large subunit
MDDNALIEAVAHSPIITATALGHATDALVLDKVVDHSFPTPTACGAWLRVTIEQKRAHLRELEQGQALQEARTFREQLQRHEDANRALAQSLEREARGRREMEARLLAQQQQLLEQLDAARQVATRQQRDAEQRREEAEATRREGDEARRAFEAARMTAAQFSQQLAALQATLKARDDTLEEQGRSLASAKQAEFRAWMVVLASAAVAALGWALLLVALLLRR